MPKKWTVKEIRILRQDYPAKGSSIAGLRKKFSKEAIRSKAKNLKIKVSKAWKQKHFLQTLEKNRVIRWGKKEIAILRREYPKQGAKVKPLLRKFTRWAIKRKANELNIPRKGLFWTREEVAKLRKNWKMNSKKLCSLFPRRSLIAIIRKGSYLGLRK